MSSTKDPTMLAKRFAGVRLPKQLRTGGGKLVDILSSPLIAALAVPVVIAGAVAMRNSKVVRAAAVKTRDKAREAMHDLTEHAGGLATAIGAGENKQPASETSSA